MAAPQRQADKEARTELYALRKAARQAVDIQWITAARMIHDQRLTAQQAAHALGVSDATFWRKIRPWAEVVQVSAQLDN